MRILVLGAIAFVIAATPVYMLNALVMPQVESLFQTYQNADVTARAIVAGAQR